MMNASGVCRKLVCHFSHSWKARVAFEKAQKELNLPAHSLISECQTKHRCPGICDQFFTSLTLQCCKAKRKTDLTKKLKNKILDYLNEKYKDEGTQELLDITSSLDPRFKMEFISVNNKPHVKARLTSEILECQSSCTEVESKVGDMSQAKKAKKSLGSFFKQSGTASKGDSSLTLKDAVKVKQLPA
ncbi:hypothetical protein NFI96_022326 [Prochilodus magdalenae]|nr:hypothetical protein NFI96_022326 [Prochilodus magdalenae]